MKAVGLSSIVLYCLSFVFLVALFPLAAYPGMGIGGDSNGTSKNGPRVWDRIAK